jgi:hypothetical protein
MLRRFFLLLITLMASLPSLARQSCEWPFRTQMDITGTTPADYQVKVNLDSNSFSSDYTWSEDGSDLRISDQDDFSSPEPASTLRFWIDTWDASSKKATIWVKTPAISGSLRLYLFYGNEYADTQASAPLTFDKPGIKFHTRYSTVNPRDLVTARAAFNAANDNNINYGCSYITNFTGITNKSQLRTGSSSVYRTASTNFAAFSESYFEVNKSGIWQFRYGADFGRGGALYINSKELEEQWDDDLWWANNWGTWIGTGQNERSTNDAQILRGSIDLQPGYHKLEVLGFESGNDGGITVQFKRPTTPPLEYSQGWETFSTNNINVFSRSCPVVEPSITFSNNDVCEIDLRIRNNGSQFPEAWVTGSPRQAIIQIRNKNNPIATSIPDSRLTITLSQGIQFLNHTGTNWNCSLISSSSVESKVDCFYTSALANQENSPSLALNIQANSTAIANATLTATLKPRQFDINIADNTISRSLPIWQLVDDVSTSCSTTSAGIFARFYNSQGYTDNYADSEAEFDDWENDLAIREKLYGQTVLSQINSDTGNPFASAGNNSSGNDYFLALMEGYLEIPEDGFYNLAVDGDDAVEFKLNDVVYSSWYGGHGAQNSAHDENTVGLAKGFHKLNYRMQEAQGGNSFYAYWRKPGDSVATIIPTSSFFHCAGEADIRLNLTVDIQDNPNTASINDKAIPGAVLRYRLVVKNEGNISTNGDNMELTQTLSSDAKLYVDDLTTTGPIIFMDGSNEDNSGLSYNFSRLNSTLDDLSFSNNGTDFNYIPTADSDGYDSNVTHIKLLLNGSMKPKYDQGIPEFAIEYQVKVK